MSKPIRLIKHSVEPGRVPMKRQVVPGRSETVPYAIEMDIMVSRDGVPFVRHHYTLGPHIFAGHLDWDDIKQYLSQDEPVLLRDVLQQYRKADLVLDLDVKGGFQPPGFAHHHVHQCLTQYGAQVEVIVSGWDLQALAIFKDVSKSIRTRVAFRGRPMSWDSFFDGFQSDIVSLDWDLACNDDIQTLRRAGLEVCLMNGWSSEFYTFAMDVQADYIIVSDVNEAVRSLDPTDGPDLTHPILW
jgi:glycerophosphoryl diester phosphodiesterase